MLHTYVRYIYFFNLQCPTKASTAATQLTVHDIFESHIVTHILGKLVKNKRVAINFVAKSASEHAC